ncbi:SNF1-interacting protein [Thoreauomyces humboldtii]|nr:SNF1-interacting protein [Thoreauomyces humboldtii]
MGNSQARPRDFNSDKETTRAAIPPARVDHGQVIPYSDSVYKTTPQDWDPPAVAGLITARRMAPFYRGLADFDENAELEATPVAASTSQSGGSPGTASTASPWTPSGAGHNRQISTSSVASLKARRSASLPTQLFHQDTSSAVALPDLYKYPVECPICFLHYPSNVNYSRCCDQPICTECFVQIKRPEATLEPAACPFCVEPNFGILYYPPGSADHKAKIVEAHPEAATPALLADTVVSSSPSLDAQADSAKEGESVSTGSQSLLAVPPHQTPVAKRRQSVSHQSASVVTSDDLRPDWLRKQQQLALARAASQRRNTFAYGTHAAAVRRTRQMYQESDARDLAGAAAAAAALVEHMGGGGQNSRHGGSVTGGVHTPRGVRTDSARRRRQQGGDVGLNYLEAMRNMGADLEELMIMEAVRRSLQQEAETATASASAGTSSASPTADTPVHTAPGLALSSEHPPASNSPPLPVVLVGTTIATSPASSSPVGSPSDAPLATLLVGPTLSEPSRPLSPSLVASSSRSIPDSDAPSTAQ